MKIKDLICSVGISGYYNWDLAGIKAGGQADGFAIVGDTVTPGFDTLVQPGETISIMLALDDGQVAFGDCMDVILSGAAGRDPLFRAAEHLPIIEGAIRERLLGADCSGFRTLAESLDEVRIDERRLHTAVRYGLSQALLHAAALTARKTMAEVVAEEYQCTVAQQPIPILSMCPTKERELVDKMILKRADILPHADFIRVKEDLGADAHLMSDYVTWLAERIDQLGGEDYKPILHLDVYGTLGEFFAMDLDRIADFLGDLERRAGGLSLLMETPVIAQTQDAQVEAFIGLKQRIAARGLSVGIVVDEWCNTFEDVKKFADARSADYIQVKAPDLGGLNKTIDSLLYCKRKGIGAYLGGSGNETDQSSRVCAHVGLACQADILIAKPGQGVDEPLMIERNEMNRTLALIARRA